MELGRRVHAFVRLGNHIKQLDEEEKNRIYTAAKAGNGWFTKESVDLAFEGLARYLEEENLSRWLERYRLPESNGRPKTVGVVMAGNIPLVGFHDLLCVLIAGHRAQAKVSAQDKFLPEYLLKTLADIEPGFSPYIELSERLKNYDAVIATGSDNSSRYFEYYFGKHPHIIRKNRTSCAVVSARDTESDLQELGKDLFQYFGLGCRNVSKIFIPEGYDLTILLDSLSGFSPLIDHHKYANNYFYNKSIFLVNQVPHFDSGFCLLKESEQLVSPVSVIYYERYAGEEQLKKKIGAYGEKIQCVVARDGWLDGSIPFGQAQQPELWDYADNVDTMEFLMGI